MTSIGMPGWHVVEFELIATAAARVALREQRAQAGEQRDASEVVDRDEQAAGDTGEPRDAGPRNEPVERAARLRFHRRDRFRTSGGGAEVGDDVGVAHVDPDDALPVGLEPGLRRRAHPRRRSRDHDRSLCVHGAHAR